jgi:hypothetical protein
MVSKRTKELELQPEFHPEHQLEFLYSVMTALNDRRTAMDQRATLIVTIAIAELGIVFTQINGLLGNFSVTARTVLLVRSVSASFVALVEAARIILPVTPRGQHLADPKNPRVAWFVSIAQFTAAEYEEFIRATTTSDLVRVMSSQVSEVSYVLKGRYFKLNFSGRALVISTLIIAVAATSNAIVPFVPWLSFLTP